MQLNSRDMYMLTVASYNILDKASLEAKKDISELLSCDEAEDGHTDDIVKEIDFRSAPRDAVDFMLDGLAIVIESRCCLNSRSNNPGIDSERVRDWIRLFVAISSERRNVRKESSRQHAQAEGQEDGA